MIFASPFGSQYAQAIGQTTSFAPQVMKLAPREQDAPFVLPEDRFSVALETICLLRSQGRTEEEIVAHLRRAIQGITDVQISQALAAAGTLCPAVVGPFQPPQQPQPPQPPEPVTPDEPTVVTLPVPPAPAKSSTKKWLILGGIAVGVIGIATVAILMRKK